MTISWVILFFAGLVCSAAAHFDADSAAKQLMQAVNKTATHTSHAYQIQFSPYTITFDASNGGFWNVGAGTLRKSGNWTKSGDAVMSKARNHLLLSVPVTVKGAQVQWEYHTNGICAEDSTMGTNITSQLNVTIMISYQDTFKCVGKVYSVKLQDFSRDLCESTQGYTVGSDDCTRHFPTEGYERQFRNIFCPSYPEWISQIAEFFFNDGLKGFNFCAL